MPESRALEMSFRSPRAGRIGAWQDRLGNAERWRAWRRACLRPFPFPRMRSDVRDIVYANWAVPIAAMSGLVPGRIALLARDGWTPVTVLTYRHRHFGPAWAGPLRRFFPSPLQSNWRLYVSEIDGVAVARPTVLFLHNIFDSALYALATRLMSDSLPSHLAAAFRHHHRDGRYETRIDGGSGSAPSFDLVAHATADLGDPGELGRFAENPAALARLLCLQDAAVCPLGDGGALAEGEIDLPIDPGAIVPLDPVRYRPGALLRHIGCQDAPFCFAVPGVRFDVVSEHILPPPAVPADRVPGAA